MSAELTLPQLPNTSVVTIARWLKKAGEQIVAHEKLLEAYSDHFDWDIPAPCDGTLQEIRAPEGARVKVGDVIAVIGEPSTVNREPLSVVRQQSPQVASLFTPHAPRPTPLAARIADTHQIDLS